MDSPPSAPAYFNARTPGGGNNFCAAGARGGVWSKEMATIKFTRTKENVEKLPESKKERAQSLLNKIVFMERQLEKLQAQLKKTGWVEEYQNGENQSGVKKSAVGEAYNSLIKNYITAVKQLEDILADVTDDVDELEQRFFK